MSIRLLISFYLVFNLHVTYTANTMMNQVQTYNLITGLPDIHIYSDSEKIGVTWHNGSVWDKPL